MSDLKIGDWVESTISHRVGVLLEIHHDFAVVDFKTRKEHKIHAWVDTTLGIKHLYLKRLAKVCPYCKESNCPSLGA